MTGLPRTLIHVLAADAAEKGSRTLRGTIRIGVPRRGMRLRIAGPGGACPPLTVEALNYGERWTTFVLSGDPEILDRVVPGLYLFGDSTGQREGNDNDVKSL